MVGRFEEKSSVFPRLWVNTPANLTGGRVWQMLLGTLMFFPSVILLVLTRLIPSIGMLMISMQAYYPADGRLVPVGFSNFLETFGSSMVLESFLFALIMTGLRILLVVLPPLCLALGLASIQPKIRRWLQLATVVPWMMYSPAVLGITWLVLLNPNYGFASNSLSLTTPERIPLVVFLMDGLSFLGLSIGICSTAFLAALKGAAEGRRRKSALKSLFVLGGIMVLATIAFSLQLFTPVQIFNLSQMTTPFYSLMVLVYQDMGELLRPGRGAALGLLIFVAAALCGLIACVLVLKSNLRLMIVSANTKPTRLSRWVKKTWLILVLVPLLALLAALLPAIMKLIPILGNPDGGLLSELQIGLGGVPFGKNLVDTWLVPLFIVLLIQLPVTYLMAVGIGILRPLGKASEWLLILFAPWLFVSTHLLSAEMFQVITKLNLQLSFFGKSFPYLINIPMLFLLVLFFKGQRSQAADRVDQVDFFKTYILPSWPLAAIGCLGAILSIQESLLWPLTIGPNFSPMPVLYAQLLAEPGLSWQGVGAISLLFSVPSNLFLMVSIGFLMVLFVPKLAIRTDRVIH